MIFSTGPHHPTRDHRSLSPGALREHVLTVQHELFTSTDGDLVLKCPKLWGISIKLVVLTSFPVWKIESWLLIMDQDVFSPAKVGVYHWPNWGEWKWSSLGHPPSRTTNHHPAPRTWAEAWLARAGRWWPRPRCGIPRSRPCRTGSPYLLRIRGAAGVIKMETSMRYLWCSSP